MELEEEYDELVATCPKCGNQNRFHSAQDKQDAIDGKIILICANGPKIKGCKAKFIVVSDGLEFIGFK